MRHMDKFNGSNYQIWKFQERTILVAHSIDDVVDGTRVEPEENDNALKTWKKDDTKAMYFISSTMEPAHIESVLTWKSIREMWTKLALIHEQKSETNKLIMTQRSHEYKMESNDTILQHISKVQNMAAQLNDVGEAFSNVAIMAKILASLPSRFNALKTAWDSVEPQKQTLENLQESLLKEETRSLADDGAMSAFTTATKNAEEALEKDAKSTANVECFNCRKKGHFAWQCPNKKKKKNDFTKKNDERNEKSDECAFMITDREESRHLIEIFDKMDVSDVWLLDSGASRHVFFKREWFTDFSVTSGE